MCSTFRSLNTHVIRHCNRYQILVSPIISTSSWRHSNGEMYTSIRIPTDHIYWLFYRCQWSHHTHHWQTLNSCWAKRQIKSSDSMTAAHTHTIRPSHRRTQVTHPLSRVQLERPIFVAKGSDSLPWRLDCWLLGNYNKSQLIRFFNPLYHTSAFYQNSHGTFTLILSTSIAESASYVATPTRLSVRLSQPWGV